MHTRPGLGSYPSEVVRFALDMRKRFTVPTDCRYIDARVAESGTTAPYIRAAAARIIAPAPSSCTRSFHDLHPNTVRMGPWVPPPTSRALAPCQITSAIPVCPTHWSALGTLHAA